MQRKEKKRTKNNKLSKEEQMYIASMIANKYIEMRKIEEEFWKNKNFTNKEKETERPKYFELAAKIFTKIDKQ